MAQAPFSDTLMDHFLHPRCSGPLPEPHGEGWSGTRGSSRYMRIQVRLDQGRITDARFATHGCAPAIACGSYLCDAVVGRTPEEAVAWSAAALDQAVGPIPPSRRFCADLAVDALKAALHQATTQATGAE